MGTRHPKQSPFVALTMLIITFLTSLARMYMSPPPRFIFLSWLFQGACLNVCFSDKMIKRKHCCLFHSHLQQCISIYAYKRVFCVFFTLTRMPALWWSRVLKSDFGTANSFNCNHPIVQKLVKFSLGSVHLLSDFVWYSTFLMKR
jgi:hypothetical protein